MLILRAMLRLTRLGTSLIGFVGVFLPLLARTNQVWTSLGRASPLLFTCICTFIANDLDDVERDRVNHPERPLPAGELSRAVAGILYFTSALPVPPLTRSLPLLPVIVSLPAPPLIVRLI